MLGLRRQTLKYKALVKSVEQTAHGYWGVTFSCAPGVDCLVTVCRLGINPTVAVADASAALTAQTGQEVM